MTTKIPPKYIRVRGSMYRLAEVLINEDDWENIKFHSVAEPEYNEDDLINTHPGDKVSIKGYTDIKADFNGKEVLLRVHWEMPYDVKRFRDKSYLESHDSGLKRLEILSPDSAKVFTVEDSQDPSTKEPLSDSFSELMDEIVVADEEGDVTVIPLDLYRDWESSFDPGSYTPSDR